MYNFSECTQIFANHSLPLAKMIAALKLRNSRKLLIWSTLSFYRFFKIFGTCRFCGGEAYFHLPLAFNDVVGELWRLQMPRWR